MSHLTILSLSDLLTAFWNLPDKRKPAEYAKLRTILDADVRTVNTCKWLEPKVGAK